MAGFSLIETMLSVGLLSVVVIGAMAAFGGVAKVSSGNPARDAAEWEMRRIITLESATAKYTDPAMVSINPAPWNTSMPMPAGTPMPMTLNASSTASGGAPAMRLTITYPQAGTTQTLTKIIPILRKAPAPMATVAAPGTYADPNSTPTP
ncbi:MAG: type II secretion system protein J [Candidatus Baltobacteraceae bacterium]